MNNIEEKFLPIGTVVMLKGGTKRVMVTGFCSVDNNEKERMYDYTGCLYPEGIINSNEICLFDNNQIDQVFFKGFVDPEEIKFKEDLKETLSRIEENKEIAFDLDSDEEDDDEPKITFELDDDLIA